MKILRFSLFNLFLYFIIPHTYCQDVFSVMGFQFNFSDFKADTVVVSDGEDSSDFIIDVLYSSVGKDNDTIVRGKKTFVNNALIFYSWISEDQTITYSVICSDKGPVRNIHLKIKGLAFVSYTFWDNGLFKRIEEYNYEGQLNGLFLEFDIDGKPLERKIYENGKEK